MGFGGFDDDVAALLDGRNFAVLATLAPDGRPHTATVWFRRSGDVLEISSIAGRRKVRNVEADPRVSVSVYDLADPYVSVEIRGAVEVIPFAP